MTQVIATIAEVVDIVADMEEHCARVQQHLYISRNALASGFRHVFGVCYIDFSTQHISHA